MKFKSGDWIIVHSKDDLLNNGNEEWWSNKFKHKVGQITVEIYPGIYQTTIDRLALFECKDFKKFKGGI